MNPERKAEWVAALRSGEYEQGRSVLAQVVNGEITRYCCLGVACDLAVKAGAIPQPDILVFSARYPFSDGFGTRYEMGTLPPPVSDWLGFSTDIDNPEVFHDGYTVSLSELNDEGVPFEKIADIIEEQL